MKLFDANMILRYLLNDNEEMASEAETLINNVNVCAAPALGCNK